MANKRRLLSILLLVSGTVLQFVALNTDSWFEKAFPTRDLKQSYIYYWESLNEACFQFPLDTPPKCSTLNTKDWKLASVKGLLYASLVIGCLQIGAIIVMVFITKRIIMDVLTIFAFCSGLFGMIAMSIYTHNNPTHVAIFDLYGYSYICGWLAVICILIGGLISFLSRVSEEDLFRMEMDK